MSPLISVAAVDIPVDGLAVEAALPADWLDRALGEVGAAPRGGQPAGPGSGGDVSAGAPSHAGGGAGGRIAVRLSRSGTDVVVRGRVEATVDLPCVRCLTPTPVTVAADLSLLLRSVGRPARPSAASIGERSGRARAGGGRPRSPAGHKNVVARGEAPATVPARAERPATDRPSARGQSAPGERPSARGARDRSSSGRRRARAAQEYEFRSDEAELDTYDGERVVLDDFVREAILLEIPSFPLCSDACPGMDAPPRPEVMVVERDEVDPRLAPLGALRDLLDPLGAGAAAHHLPPIAHGPGEPAARGGHPMLRSTVRGIGKRKNRK